MRNRWTKIFGAGAFLLVALFAWSGAQAQDCQLTGCDPCGKSGCGYKSPWYFGGWGEAGIYANQYGQRNDYSAPFGTWANNWDQLSGNTLLLGPARQADLQMNQAWVYGGKKMNTACGFDWGVRLDAMYGTDGIYTQSTGFEVEKNTVVDNGSRWGEGDYFFSIPQAYAEVGYKTVSLKAGKFLTNMGSESVMAPCRFFYSTSYAYTVQTHTQTGAVATWKPYRNFAVFGGWTCGEEEFFLGDNPSVGSSFADSDNNAALFGVNYALNCKWNLGYTGLLGRESDAFNLGFDRDYYVHAFQINYKPNRCWDYTFEWTLRDMKYDDPNNVFSNTYYGINNELIYKYNRCWAFGLRGEWMHADDDSFFVDNDMFEVTLGANWTPNKHLVVRPEVRYDYGKDSFAFDGGNEDSQLGFGVSTIVKF